MCLKRNHSIILALKMLHTHHISELVGFGARAALTMGLFLCSITVSASYLYSELILAIWLLEVLCSSYT